MKTPHLLRVEEGPERFAALVAAARAEGIRVGWLELAPAGPAPATLEAAAALGCLRAVAVGERRAVAVKPIAGPPVLRDLLREHFLGCRVVLVRGELDAPALAADGEAWRVAPQSSPERTLTTPELLALLRKPHPWGGEGPDAANSPAGAAG
ncbi:MAG TPA: hypothetical protein VNJ70_02755 [Thermoanaerobaculia bacterium]|nr:hypothetical protein [Thermoanaerobaculia bacterium]